MNAHVNSEHSTSKLLPLFVRTRHPQLRPHKTRTRDILRRQVHLPDNFPLRTNPENSSLAVNRLPDITFFIHPETIWVAFAVVLVEYPLVGDGIGGAVVVEGQNLFGRGVGEVEGFLVAGPTYPVWDCEGCEVGCACEIGREVKEGPYNSLVNVNSLCFAKKTAMFPHVDIRYFRDPDYPQFAKQSNLSTHTSIHSQRNEARC